MPGNQPFRRGQQEGPSFQGPSADDIKKIILDGDVVLLVQWADKIGEVLARERLSTSQIRNIFGTVRQIQLRWDKPGSPTEIKAHRDAVLLRPKLAYFAEREKRAKGGAGSSGMEILAKALDPALELLGRGAPNREHFERFGEFFEAIVAYHKKHGSK